MNLPTLLPRVVFDCNTVLQGAARQAGPAAACLKLVETEQVRLCLSPQILTEMRDVLLRPKLQRKFPALTPERVEAILAALQEKSEGFPEVPRVFELPRDPKDEPYLNLAIAAGVRYLVTRDKDLLDLMDRSLTDGQAFRTRFPHLLILDPVSFLLRLLQQATTAGLVDFFARVLVEYRALIDREFPHLLHRFEPGGDFDYGVHISLGEDRRPQMWCFLRLVEGEARVSGSVGAFSWEPNEFVQEQFVGTGGLPTWRPVPDLEKTVPESYAFHLVDQQVRKLLERGELVESWHLVYQRGADALRRLTNPLWRGEKPILPLDAEQPITSEVFRETLLRILQECNLAPLEMREMIIVQGKLAVHTGSSVDLGQLDADILWLEQQGHPLHGPLLPDPDISFDDPARIRGNWTWSRYSDDQLGDAARQSLTYLVEAYREMAELNFPNLCSKMGFYEALPLEIECAIDRRGDSRLWEEADWAFVNFRRGASAFAVNVVVVSAQSSAEAVAEFDRIRGDFGRTEVFRALSSAVTLFIDGKDWREHLLRMLTRDFETAWQRRYPIANPSPPQDNEPSN